MRNLSVTVNWFKCLVTMAVMLLPFSFPAGASVFPDFSFRTVTAFDGLSSNIVNVIYKDKRGFVWLGTQTGLDRFDGVSVVSFSLLAGQTVLSLTETDSVHLMVGTDKGLFRFDRKRETVEAVSLNGQMVRVNALYFDASADNLFVVTNHGLYISHKGQMKQVFFGDSAFSSENELTGVIKGNENGVFWITSQESLIRYDIKSGDSEIFYPDAENLKKGSKRFSCLALGDNRIYLGTRNGGVYLFNLRTKTFSRFPEMQNGDIKQIMIDDDNMLYVGCNGDGIQIFDLSSGIKVASLVHTSREDEISSNAVYSFLKEGDLFFVGSYMGGFSYVPTRDCSFSVYSEGLFDSNGLNVRAFYVDEEKRNMVIGTRDGLYFWCDRNGRLMRYTQRNSIIRSDIILFVAPFGKDYLVGTYRGGLYVLSSASGQLSFFADEDLFKTDSFSCFTYDGEGCLWIGGAAGLYECNPETREYKLYNKTNSSLTYGSIFSVLADSKGRIWVGAGGALFMYNKQTGVFNKEVLPENLLPFTTSVRYIYEDSRYDLWFCDEKEGIVKADAGFTHFEHYTTDSFLPNNSVMSIVESPDGKGFWFTTQDGLLYVDRQTGNRKIFSIYDGLPGYVFNYAAQVTSDKTLWWGNEKGLVLYRQKKGGSGMHVKNLCLPTITDIFIAGKRQKAGSALMPYSAPFTDAISLSSSENNIALNFSALNYAERNTMLYEYCLEGYDRKWRILSRGNQVAYTELPVGDYLFKVRSFSDPEVVRTLKITVNPDYGYIIRIIGVLLFCVLVFLFFYAGVFRKLLRQKTGDKVVSGNKIPDMPKEKYQKSRIDIKTAADIEKKLRSCMENDRLYLNPDLKLQDVASDIGFNASDVSQTLNVFMNTNFTDFVNQYRVEMFISRMKEEGASKYTLASLSEECGFSSRTSFFRSFRKLKGMSPSEYIRAHGNDSVGPF